MNFDNLCMFLAITVPLSLIARYFLLRPIERRLEVALDAHLAKAIAKSLYYEIYPDALPEEHDYYADNERRERILNRSIEAFKALLKDTKPGNLHG